MRNLFRGVFKRGNINDPNMWITKLLNAASAAGINVTTDKALKQATVYACVKVISETLSSLPFILYERVGDGGKTRAVNHPLYKLMHDGPNEYMTSYEYREIMSTHLNLNGNHYSQKVRGNGGIKELIPLNPSKMKVEQTNVGIVYTYTYEDGKHEEFRPDQIWHIKLMPISCSHNANAPEGILGVSPITMAKETLGSALAADEYGARYFANNATIGLNFQFPGKLSDNAKAWLKETLSEYSKLENKFKPLITEEGGKIEQLGISNSDSQFLESRNFNVEEIARIFRVPPILLGHPTNTMTYASAEQIFLSFGKFTILPWCRRIEHSANRYLLSPKDREKYFFEFNLEGLLRADTKTRYEAYASARQWGWMNPNEIRKLENMDPLPDDKGDIYLEPENMRPAGEYKPKTRLNLEEEENASPDTE